VRIRVDYKIRLKYVFEYLFTSKTARTIGQEIYDNKLTSSGEYSCCNNKVGELALCQWICNYFKKDIFIYRVRKLTKNYNFLYSILIKRT